MEERLRTGQRRNTKSLQGRKDWPQEPSCFLSTYSTALLGDVWVNVIFYWWLLVKNLSRRKSQIGRKLRLLTKSRCRRLHCSRNQQPPQSYFLVEAKTIKLRKSHLQASNNKNEVYHQSDVICNMLLFS